MKTISIAGNIGKDAVVRTTQSGDKVAGWSVAVEERAGQEKRTIWFDCAMWGKRGEALAPYLTKGGKVSVSGELSTREHEGKTYLTIRVSEVALQGGKPDPREDYTDASKGGERAGMEDSIPF